MGGPLKIRRIRRYLRIMKISLTRPQAPSGRADGLPPLPPTPISGARFWHDFSVFLCFSMLRRLSGALLGSVDIDLISRIRFSAPELLFPASFRKMSIPETF